MGWCTGSYLAEDLWNTIRGYIPEDKRKDIARNIIEIFNEQDADCWDDDMNIVKDAEYKEE